MSDITVVRKVQLVELEIIKVIDKICRDNGITYYLCAGTALGAVRHKGFIPWDDDLDIMLKREDYDRLIELLKTELPSDLWLQCYDTDKNYWQPFAKVRKLGTVYKEKGQEKLPDEKCGVWVDIFPLDYAKKVGVSLKLRRFITKTVSFSLRQRELGLKFSVFSRRYAPILILYRLFPKSLLKKLQLRAMKHSQKNKGLVVNLASTYEVNKETHLNEWFDNATETDFEDTKFLIPCGYDMYLKRLYNDYMQLPPEDKRRGHNINDFSNIVV